MHVTCRQWIVDILQSHVPLVALAVRQRTKFEGWLKLELACRAEKEGASSVMVEASFDEGSGRSDIAFYFDNIRYDLELKTPNTNWRVPGVAKRTRPITKNVASIVQDARKLEGCSGQGIVAFVLFPVPQGDNRWRHYLQRISHELENVLSENDHCTRVNVPLASGASCEVVVCSFAYPEWPKHRTDSR